MSDKNQNQSGVADESPRPAPLPTIKEMSGLVNFGGRVVFDGDDQFVLNEAEYADWKSTRDAETTA